MKLHEILDPLITLAQDVHADEPLHQDGSPVHRRRQLRSLYSHIEGANELIKLVCKCTMEDRQHRRVPTNLTPGESAILGGKSYELRNDGTVDSKDLMLRTSASVRFVNRVFNALYERDKVELDVNSAGWCSFQRYIAVRNRITHPKPGESYAISDSEWTDTQRALEWYNDLIFSYITAIIGNELTPVSKAARTVAGRLKLEVDDVLVRDGPLGQA